MNDIKKAFEQMKKELAKECGISGGFVMNRKQIENRTATYYAGSVGYRDENSVKAEMYRIMESGAFARFESVVGACGCRIEVRNTGYGKGYYIRFDY